MKTLPETCLLYCSMSCVCKRCLDNDNSLAVASRTMQELQYFTVRTLGNDRV